MAGTGLLITEAGKQLLTRAQTGERFQISHVAIGNGEIPGSLDKVAALSNELYRIEQIQSSLQGSILTLIVDFPRREEDYEFKELGVFVNVGKEQVLYAYTHLQDESQHIRSGVEFTEKRVRLSLVIDGKLQVNIKNESVLYAKSTDLDLLENQLNEIKSELIEHFNQEKNGLNAKMEDMNRVSICTLRANAWEGVNPPFSQTVSVPGIKAADNPILVSKLSVSANVETQKAYIKAFGLITAGTGQTGEGFVTFRVYKKPSTDVTIGLKGV